MAKSNRAVRRATAAQAKTETSEATIPSAAEATIPEAKVLVETTQAEAVAEQLPNPEAQPTEEEPTERPATVLPETGSVSEAAGTTVQDLQEAARAEGEVAVADEAPPMGLAKTSWIVPGPCTKRAGTDAWRSFQCYGEGCTVEEYLSAKGHSSRRKARESLRWDVQRGLVKVLEARPVVAEESSVGEKEAAAA